MQQTPHHLSQVQLTRAAAALLVVLGHIISDAGKFVDGDSAILNHLGRIPFGIGVDIFFVISGFIMVYITSARLQERGFATTFLLDRIARIVPNYWLYTTLVCAGLAILPSAFDNTKFDAAQIAHSYFFFPGWTETELPILKLGWTLNYEMFFYAVFSVGILLAGRRAPWMIGATLCAFAAIYFSPIALAAPFSYWFAPIIIEFAFGMLIAQIHLKGFRLGVPVAWALIVLAVILVPVLQSFEGTQRRFVVLGIPSAIAVFAIVGVPEWRSLRSPLLRFAEKIGDASYTLYLAHPFVLTCVYLVCRAVGLTGGWGLVAYFVAAVVLSVAYSIFAYRYIERPLTQMTRAFTPKTRPRQTV